MLFRSQIAGGKTGQPQEKPKRAGRVGQAVPGAGIGEARPRRPKEGGSVKDLESIYQKKERRENCEKIVKNCPINKLKVMTENCEIVKSTN